MDLPEPLSDRSKHQTGEIVELMATTSFIREAERHVTLPLCVIEYLDSLESHLLLQSPTEWIDSYQQQHKVASSQCSWRSVRERFCALAEFFMTCREIVQVVSDQNLILTIAQRETLETALAVRQQLQEFLSDQVSRAKNYLAPSVARIRSYEENVGNKNIYIERAIRQEVQSRRYQIRFWDLELAVNASKMLESDVLTEDVDDMALAERFCSLEEDILNLE